MRKVLVAKNPDLQRPYGDTIARVARDLVKEHGYTNIVSASSGFGKDVVPRLGGLLDLQAITDVIEVVEGGEKFKRPVYAGNAVATVSTSDSTKLLTVRPTNFEKVPTDEAENGYPVEDVNVNLEGIKGKWI